MLIPLFIENNDYSLLFEKRSAKIRQGGEISFPGGEYEPTKDTSLEETAVRETVEELGIEKSKIRMLGSLGTLIAPMGFTLDVFVAVIDINDINNLKHDKNEVEKIFAVPVSYFKKNEPDKYSVRVEANPFITNDSGERVELFPVKELGLPERYHGPWKNGLHRILVYKVAGEVIWGLTAEIIYEFSNLMP